MFTICSQKNLLLLLPNAHYLGGQNLNVAVIETNPSPKIVQAPAAPLHTMSSLCARHGPKSSPSSWGRACRSIVLS